MAPVDGQSDADVDEPVRNAGQTDGSRPPATPRRRTTEFTRSRGGCEACKLHKKKCDQQRPLCSRCSKGGKTCRYPAPVTWVSGACEPVPSASPPILEQRFSTGAGSDQLQQVQTGVTPAGPLEPLETSTDTRFDSTLNVNASATAVDLPDPTQVEQVQQVVAYPTTGETIDTWDTFLCHDLDVNGATASTTRLSVTDPSLPIDWSFAGDTFLQALFSLGPEQPFPEAGQNAHSGPPPCVTAEVPAVRGQNNGPLAVPIDCDPALWSFFVDTSRWEEQAPNDGERNLLEYFMNTTAFGVVIKDGQARRFYQDVASRAKVEKGRALMHAVLCVSAQHLSNKARTEDDRSRMKRYRDISTEHRAQALHLLRVAAASESACVAADISPTIMILLILATLLKGESGIIPSFLDQTSKLLDKAAGSRTSSEVDLAFLPSVSALHSMYTAFHSLNAQKQINLSSLFPSRDERSVWSERSDEVVETVVGMPRAVLMTLLKANDLVMEYDTVMKALSRETQDDELSMMRIELQARASALDADLADAESWSDQHAYALTDRIRVGQECARIAARSMILVDILDDEIDSPQMTGLVERFADQLDACEPRLEVGLTWPYMVVASYAPARLRPRMSAFIKRAQWKGSAVPLTAEAVVKEVWRDMDSGESRKTWRTCILARGGPVIL